jgi:hypothetical protein
MSAICSLVPTYSTRMLFSTTFSHRKLNFIGMCFVLECITGFFEILMELVLSQYIEMGSSYSTCIYVNVCFIHRTYVQNVVSSIYSNSAIDNDIDDCFFLAKIPNTHPTRTLLHLYFFGHQCNLPNMHLRRK